MNPILPSDIELTTIEMNSVYEPVKQHPSHRHHPHHNQHPHHHHPSSSPPPSSFRGTIYHYFLYHPYFIPAFLIGVLIVVFAILLISFRVTHQWIFSLNSDDTTTNPSLTTTNLNNTNSTSSSSSSASVGFSSSPYSSSFISTPSPPPSLTLSYSSSSSPSSSPPPFYHSISSSSSSIITTSTTILASSSLSSSIHPSLSSSSSPSLPTINPSTILYSIGFDIAPSGISNPSYRWASFDPSDSANDQTFHTGLIFLNGKYNNFINLAATTGVNSLGTASIVPPSNLGGTDLSFEVTVKISTPRANTGAIFSIGPSGQSSCINNIQFLTTPTGEICNPSSQLNSISSGTEMLLNTWYHFVFVLTTSGNYMIYQNGVLIGIQYSQASPIATSRANVYLGISSYSGTSNYFTGVIDKFVIYSTALTSLQVQFLYQQIFAFSNSATLQSLNPMGANWYRNIYHYSPQENWMNDPCGLIYDPVQEEWHLFSQYSTFQGTVDATGISWGHAISKDLISWNEIGVAIQGSPSTIGIFSGTAVFDTSDTSGLCPTSGNCMVLVFAANEYTITVNNVAVQDIRIAVSTDSTYVSFTPYASNPVIYTDSSNFRDPIVFWYDSTTPSNTIYNAGHSGYWVALITGYSSLFFYKSTNLKSWTSLSTFNPTSGGGTQVPDMECPSIFPMYVNETNQLIWVLSVCNGGIDVCGYVTGSFDGTTFTQTSTYYTLLNSGLDFYSVQFFSNSLNEAYTKVMIAWLYNWNDWIYTPTSPWRGAYTLPVQATLHQYHDVSSNVVNYLQLTPSPQLYTYRNKSVSYVLSSPITLTGGGVDPRVISSTLGFSGGSVYEIQATFSVNVASPASSSEVNFRIRSTYTYSEYTAVGIIISSSVTSGTIPIQIYFDRTLGDGSSFLPSFQSRTTMRIPYTREYATAGTTLSLQIFVDQSTVEIFGANGLFYASFEYYPTPPTLDNYGLELVPVSGSLVVSSLTIYPYYGASFTSSSSNSPSSTAVCSAYSAVQTPSTSEIDGFMGYYYDIAGSVSEVIIDTLTAGECQSIACSNPDYKAYLFKQYETGTTGVCASLSCCYLQLGTITQSSTVLTYPSGSLLYAIGGIINTTNIISTAPPTCNVLSPMNQAYTYFYDINLYSGGTIIILNAASAIECQNLFCASDAIYIAFEWIVFTQGSGHTCTNGGTNCCYLLTSFFIYPTLDPNYDNNEIAAFTGFRMI